MVKSHAVLISSCIIAARITPPKISLAKSKHKSPSFSKTKFVLKSLYPFIKAKIYVFPEPINKTKEFVSQSIPNRFLGRIPTNCQNDSSTLTRMLHSELERGFDKRNDSRASDESPSVRHSTPPANLCTPEKQAVRKPRDMRKPKAVLACYRVIRNLTTTVPHLEKKGRETLVFPPLSANFSIQIRTFPSEYEEKKCFLRRTENHSHAIDS